MTKAFAKSTYPIMKKLTNSILRINWNILFIKWCNGWLDGVATADTDMSTCISAVDIYLFKRQSHLNKSYNKMHPSFPLLIRQQLRLASLWIDNGYLGTWDGIDFYVTLYRYCHISNNIDHYLPCYVRLGLS